MTLGERVAEMKDQTPPEIRQAGAADFPRREAASFNQALDRMRGSAVTRIEKQNVMSALPLIGQLGR
jgi:hypothetical protein